MASHLGRRRRAPAARRTPADEPLEAQPARSSRPQLAPPGAIGRRSALVASATAATMLLLLLQTTSSQPAEAQQTSGPAAKLAERLVEQLAAAAPASPMSQAGLQFEGAKFASLHEAIRAHPDLTKFARLCDLRGVHELVAIGATPLTVFAPVDRALADLLARAEARQLNLAELAKHHIAQGALLADTVDKFPHKFQSYIQSSPLYLNRVLNSRGASELLVNNAKILATYLIPIESDFQVLHVIDAPLEFAYQVGARPRPAGNDAARARNSAGRSSGGPLKRPLELSFLADGEPSEPLQQALVDYLARFADYSSSQPEVELYRARAGGALAPSALNAAAPKWARLIKLDQASSGLLEGRLYKQPALATYFLPVDSDELDQLLARAEEPSASAAALLALRAHVLPNEVLFTRALPLGQQISSPSSPEVALSLAKTLPSSLMAQLTNQSSAQQSNVEQVEQAPEQISRRLLATPLLVQAATSGSGAHQQLRAGVTSAEILVANVPLSNGVLHLIKRPLVMPLSPLLDFITDHERQLSDLVQSIGSQTARSSANNAQQQPLELNRFRELLARADRHLLSLFNARDQSNANRTILAPSDAAFARLRFDLRALIAGDEQLIPAHWDASYRQIQLERILKRHLIEGQTLTSFELARDNALATTLNNFQLSFSAPAGQPLQVHCDSTRAQLLQQDILASNGALHLIDRVLGEELETIHSLLSSLVLKFAAKYAPEVGAAAPPSPLAELSQLIEANLKAATPNSHNDLEQGEQGGVEAAAAGQLRRQSPELKLVGKSVEQFLNELAHDKRQLIASSVNMSLELARAAARAEGRDDWNEKFKQHEKAYTYFVPTDLAWLRLVQLQPELYKPLVYFLEQRAAPGALVGDTGSSDQASASGGAGDKPRASESSHRLLQVLERHLIGNKKLNARDLNQLETLHSVGGVTLRLVAQHANNLAADGGGQAASAFAALHSIATATPTPTPGEQPLAHVRRALQLASSASPAANIVEAHETSNGFVYLVDQVLTQPEDAELLAQTSSAPSAAISGAMSSLLGAHNSALLDAVQGLFAAQGITSASTMISLIGALLTAIVLLTLLLLLLVLRRRRQSKLTRHQQLESGLTSSSSASNSGSTSTTKSL